MVVAVVDFTVTILGIAAAVFNVGTGAFGVGLSALPAVVETGLVGYGPPEIPPPFTQAMFEIATARVAFTVTFTISSSPLAAIILFVVHSKI